MAEPELEPAVMAANFTADAAVLSTCTVQCMAEQGNASSASDNVPEPEPEPVAPENTTTVPPVGNATDATEPTMGPAAEPPPLPNATIATELTPEAEPLANMSNAPSIEPANEPADEEQLTSGSWYGVTESGSWSGEDSWSGGEDLFASESSSWEEDVGSSNTTNLNATIVTTANTTTANMTNVTGAGRRMQGQDAQPADPVAFGVCMAQCVVSASNVSNDTLPALPNALQPEAEPTMLLNMSNATAHHMEGSESDSESWYDLLEPEPEPEPAVDCVGNWTACNATCVTTYFVAVVPSATGLACVAADGDVRACAAGEGACPPDIDCVGEWTDCDGGCTSVYSVTIPRSGNGAVCGSATGATAQCSPGEGLCPAVDCAGNWTACDASCEKTYAVGVPASTTGTILGAACSVDHGAVAGCAAGVDECPPNIDCVGSYSTCDETCEHLYTVSVAQSGNGSACEAANQSVGRCSPGEDLCPVGSCQGSWSVCQGDCGNKTYSVTVAATGGIRKIMNFVLK